MAFPSSNAHRLKASSNPQSSSTNKCCLFRHQTNTWSSSPTYLLPPSGEGTPFPQLTCRPNITFSGYPLCLLASFLPMTTQTQPEITWEAPMSDLCVDYYYCDTSACCSFVNWSSQKLGATNSVFYWFFRRVMIFPVRFWIWPDNHTNPNPIPDLSEETDPRG